MFGKLSVLIVGTSYPRTGLGLALDDDLVDAAHR